jgi:spermidine/putrescine transport system permease protein
MLLKYAWWQFALIGLVWLALAFLYVPIASLVVFSFNDSPVTSLPLSGFTTKWYEAFFANSGMLRALWNSIIVATSATFLTLLIGVPAALAIDRYEFPLKAVFTRTLLLPLTLPGIVTGIAMLNFYKQIGITPSLVTVVIGHATALVGVVVTQVVARLQRLNKSLEEASSDLGATPFQTFTLVTLPNIKTAILGSALLAFTLSFDEIPVTFFLTGRENTLPMYIYSTLRIGITPEINAVGTLIVLFSIILIATSVLMLKKEQ